MSRFGNLELGDGSEERSHQAPQTGARDEAHFLAEARTAFENGRFESALRHFSKVLEFNPRCARAGDICRNSVPQPDTSGSEQLVRCHFPLS